MSSHCNLQEMGGKEGEQPVQEMEGEQEMEGCNSVDSSITYYESDCKCISSAAFSS